MDAGIFIDIASKVEIKLKYDSISTRIKWGLHDFK